MTDFDRRLVLSLRADAEEIAMSTDTSGESVRLSERLDEVDRQRTTTRRRVAVWGAVAATIALFAGAAVAVGMSRREADVTPVAPTPSPSASASPFTTASFVVPLTLTPPAWAAPATTTTDLVSDRRLSWGQSVCVAGTDCTWGNDFKLRIIAPLDYYPGGDTTPRRPFPTYDAYVAYLASLTAQGVAVTDLSQTTVDGRRATVMTMTPTKTLDGAFGCELPESPAKACWGPDINLVIRLAVIDAPGQPLVLWSRAAAANPSAQQSLDEFDQMLTSITFN